MSSTSESFQTYIADTLTSEERAVQDAARDAAERHAGHLENLRQELKAALDENRQKRAIQLVSRLMEDSDEEDEELQSLFHFLLDRVGVAPREPYFVFSSHPFVQTVSALCVGIPLIFLVSHLLSAGSDVVSRQTDGVTCLLATLLLGTPLIDCGIASVFNYINRYRLQV